MPYFLPAAVTRENARQIEADGIANWSNLNEIDCLNLNHFDSSLLAVLLNWRKKILAEQGYFLVLNTPPKLAVLARVYGVAELLGIPV